MRLGDARRRDDALGGGQEGRQPVVVGSVDQLDVELDGETPLGVVDGVVDGDDVQPALPQRPHRGGPGDGEPVHEDHGRSAEMRVKSAMNRPRAAATHAAAISQKRMITVVSGQPSSSKW